MYSNKCFRVIIKKYLESYDLHLKTFSCNFFQDHLNYFPLSFFEQEKIEAVIITPQIVFALQFIKTYQTP